MNLREFSGGGGETPCEQVGDAVLVSLRSVNHGFSVAFEEIIIIKKMSRPF